jgi:alpha,alpha-trehalose phosphorylase (configuration-retaining)
VPKPRPGIFRITKNIHNILQGVAQSDLWVTSGDKKVVTDWINDNAARYWFSDGGPLLDPAKGGADVIVVRTRRDKGGV